MGTPRIGKSEFARDETEIPAEEDREVAENGAPLAMGRLLPESIALAEARGSTVTLDEGFMKDVEEGVTKFNEPWNPPSWQ